MANPSYNAVMGRYKTGPRGPKVVSKETLSRLSDPAKGKYMSPSREAEKDALFSAQTRRQREEQAGDGSSFFLTEYEELKASDPPGRSSFRNRLEEVARAAGSIAENVPESPVGNKYTSAQRVAESKRKARLMENLLNGADAIKGARQSAKQNSQSRQAESRLNRVKKATQSAPVLPKSRTTTGGSQMSRNRQAKVDSQASIMRGRGREAKTRYDPRTGRVNSKRPNRSRNPSQSREPSVTRGQAGRGNPRDRSVDRSSSRVRDRSTTRDRSVGRSARDRSVNRNKPEWIENTSSVAEKERLRKEKLAKQRDERRKVFAERKAKNEKSFNSSIRSNSSADNSVKKVPTGVVSGSRSAATLRRKPSHHNAPSDSDRSTDERRARTEQRAKKSTTPMSTASQRRVARRTPTKMADDSSNPPSTKDSDGNNSLQYSVSSAGSLLGKTSKKSPSKSHPPVTDARRRLLEKKGLPTSRAPTVAPSETENRCSSRTRSTKPAIPGRAPSATSTSKENKFPERFRSSDRDELLASVGRVLKTDTKGPESGVNNDVESVLKKAEAMSSALKGTQAENGKSKADSDTASFAALLATHAKRISGQLESAQSMDENYKKLTGGI